MEARVIIVTDTPPDQLEEVLAQYRGDVEVEVARVQVDEAARAAGRPAYGLCRELGASGMPFAADYIPRSRPGKLYAYIVALRPRRPSSTVSEMMARMLLDRLLRLGWCLAYTTT